MIVHQITSKFSFYLCNGKFQGFHLIDFFFNFNSKIVTRNSYVYRLSQETDLKTLIPLEKNIFTIYTNCSSC